MTVKENVFSAVDPRDMDNDIVVFANEDDGATITVGETMAMDSYNRDVKCTFYLGESEVRELMDWFALNFPKAETS